MYAKEVLGRCLEWSEKEESKELHRISAPGKAVKFFSIHMYVIYLKRNANQRKDFRTMFSST